MAVKILLVDDAQDLLDAYVAFLEATTQYDIRTAASGIAALQVLRRWRPDIVVTDISMPDMDGLELITRIRSDLAPPLPVLVAVSGFPEFEHEARRRGAQVFQVKPIDTDDLVTLIESLLADREPPDAVRAQTEARRQQLSNYAQAAVSATLTRRPHYADVARLGMRLLSRYFDDVDTAIFLVGERGPEIFASCGWAPDVQPERALGYALDVVVSGSTLIVPDLETMPNGTPRDPLRGRRLFAAVPVRTGDGLAIGALAVADQRPVHLDVHDVGILEHIAKRLGAVFSGSEGPGMLQEPAILRPESWRHCLGCEVGHLGGDQSLVVALASIPGELVIPGATPEQLDYLERATDRLVERLPPRTALGRLTPITLAAYSIVADPEAGEHALLSLIAAIEGEPRRACVGMLSTTGLHLLDNGAALLDITESLLGSAKARGAATTLAARLAPVTLDQRLAS